MTSSLCSKALMHQRIFWTRRSATREPKVVTPSRGGSSEAVHARYQHGEPPDQGASSGCPPRGGRADGSSLHLGYHERRTAFWPGKAAGRKAAAPRRAGTATTRRRAALGQRDCRALRNGAG